VDEKERKQKPVEIVEVAPATRVITSAPDWKYVNVRRRVIYIKESIEKGLEWAAFEPNNESTWAAVRRSVSDFLLEVWRDGALEGEGWKRHSS